ncbi:sigma-70 family RNA polymerase sigma factor [Phenylobacterium montanum]|uniref:Sigma-70 family RNA polymerase sigma factor n=1 Tax=Phenylobacterium montanum TaxID=2823693 RepID=A0A975IUP3_9CAUL|nr:sigma-70 family RNA polymerase sigma factor [Caulobacter sp. S6]QUD88172.1 sigma-70 family RNA polymerase sigma factor [Caulobacter sp. S6]
MADGSLGPEAVERLMTELRPRLHRYCARMVGSAFDGEDVVQDALAKAAEALPSAGPIARPESWLFRIAHNAALDALRKRKRQAVVWPGEEMAEIADATALADARVAATASLAALMRLAPAQRSCVVLMDVLGHSLAETAEILELSVAAVKAALHRGRTALQARADDPQPTAPIPAAERERLRAYADRFNARDFDALRALLAEDVRLDLVARTRLASRNNVSVYFTRYAEAEPWRLAVGLAEGRLVLMASRLADPAARPVFVVQLDWRQGEIAAIRDFHYAPYVMDSLEVVGA